MANGLGAWLEKLQIGMEIGSNETIKQAVMAGMGIAFLSAHAVALELQVGRLVTLDVRGFPHMQNWYVVHHREKHLPPVAKAFKDFLLKDGASLIEAITHVRARGRTIRARGEQTADKSRTRRGT
jgi:DNA-binding transcriptional LysR family regulator